MKKSAQVEHPSTERDLHVQNSLRKCNTAVCFKQGLMAMCAQLKLGAPDRPCVHCQIQHSQPIGKHTGRRLLGLGFKHTVTLYLQDTDMCELLRASGKERVSTVHGRNEKWGERRGEGKGIGRRRRRRREIHFKDI